MRYQEKRKLSRILYEIEERRNNLYSMQMNSGDSSCNYDPEVGLVNQTTKADRIDCVLYGIERDQAE
jgi:hypothetical protein